LSLSKSSGLISITRCLGFDKLLNYRFATLNQRSLLTMPYMYILECADGSYYVGSTTNMERRLWEHNEGLGAKYTAGRRPVKLVYVEETDSIEEAYRREKHIHGWSRAKRQALIRGEYERLPELAKKNFGDE
jgi:putative endonuclease